MIFLSLCKPIPIFENSGLDKFLLIYKFYLKKNMLILSMTSELGTEGCL